MGVINEIFVYWTSYHQQTRSTTNKHDRSKKEIPSEKVFLEFVHVI